MALGLGSMRGLEGIKALVLSSFCCWAFVKSADEAVICVKSSALFYKFVWEIPRIWGTLLWGALEYWVC